MTDHGMVHWTELQTRDVKKAKDFYGKSLGWSFNDMPMGTGAAYPIIMMGSKMVGGISDMNAMMGEAAKGMPEHWFTYFAVDDLDKRLKALKAAGGKVLREPWDVPGVGKMAIVADSGGATQGWMVPTSPGSGGSM